MRHRPIWYPPAGVKIAPTPDTACAVVVPLERVALHANNDGVPQLRGWCGGRNHVVLDDSDEGVDADVRRYMLGCALVAQTHMDLTRYVADFDISLPLSLPPTGRSGALPLATLEHIGRTTQRKHWLTFKGSMYVDAGAGVQRQTLFALRGLGATDDGDAARHGIEVWQRCHKAATASASERHRCERHEHDFNAAPSYVELLNTTFAIVPAGRQPASYRLAEVMAAGAIPIFVSGDRYTSSPYVRPFGEVIDWPSISLHFSWEAVPTIPRALRRLSPERVAAMQRGVRHAWSTYLHPLVASQTFYGMLEARALSRMR